MKRTVLAAAAALLTVGAAAFAQPYGPGYGPGGGYGPGYGMGPGMMGGYGPGGGYGMGPGMMGGYGPGGGYGMGPGMMGGYGPGGGYGMGPGMMGGFGPGYGYYDLDLSADQRAKIGDIQREFAEKRWELMGKLHAQDGPMSQAFAGPFDEKAARKAYDAMTDAHKKMFEASLQMRKKVEALLTPEQREQMGRGWRGRGPR